MTAADLVAGNHSARFWRFADSPAPDVWAEAARAAPAVGRGEARLVDGRLEVRPPAILERALRGPR